MSSFVDALHSQNSKRVPVWFMRQAGRYLPEYMEIKNKSNFKTMSTTPDLIQTITLQPLKRFDLDAAIIFSDILTPLGPMGASFDFGSKGPELKDHGPDALLELRELNPSCDMGFVREAMKLVLDEIQVPLIGFVGAPFTLASYLIEGGGSREFRKTKTFMYNERAKFMSGLDHLAEELSKYINYQIDSGVSAIQIFDSWGGILSLGDYDRFILPSLDKMLSNIKPIPVIFYTQPSLHLLPGLSKLKISAISLDWRCGISRAYRVLKECGADIAIQGNLDPMTMTADYSYVKESVLSILNEAEEIGLERFIFNVGQGLTPQTRIDNVEKIIKEVHKYRDI